MHYTFAVFAACLLGSSTVFAQSGSETPSMLAPRDLSGPPAPESSISRRYTDPVSGCSVRDVNALVADAVTWSGACAEGFASGEGTAVFSQAGKQVMSLKAHFDEGRARDGNIVATWPDGSIYDGEAVAGRMQGFGLLTTASGDRFRGQWENGRLNGHGLAVWTNGDRYEGGWREGKAEGRGIQIWADGRQYDGEWRNDLPNGQGTVTRADKETYDAFFVDGQPQGAGDIGKAAAITLAGAPAEGGGTLINAAMAAPARPAGIDDLAGKTFSALNGSMLKLSPIGDGMTREITKPDGTVEKTIFVFLSDTLGTVYEGESGGAVAGIFQRTETGIAANYADGRAEILMPNHAGGISLTRHGVEGTSLCTAWYPEGHTYSVEERKGALAEYARSLGLAEAGDTSPGASSASCAKTPLKIGTPRVKPNAAPVGATLGQSERSAKTKGEVPAMALNAAPRAHIEVRPSPVRPVDESSASLKLEDHRGAADRD